VTGLTIVPAFGVLGAAGARSVIQILVACLLFWYVAHRLQCVTPYRALALIWVAALASAAVAYGVVSVVPAPVSMLLAIPLGVVTYILAARWVGALPESDVRRLQSAVDFLPDRLRPAAVAALGLLRRERRST
jgi:O-antigen/teichoic acid export membrane protein